jgi:hypothetical protein
LTHAMRYSTHGPGSLKRCTSTIENLTSPILIATDETLTPRYGLSLAAHWRSRPTGSTGASTSLEPACSITSLNSTRHAPVRRLNNENAPRPPANPDTFLTVIGGCLGFHALLTSRHGLASLVDCYTSSRGDQSPSMRSTKTSMLMS